MKASSDVIAEHFDDYEVESLRSLSPAVDRGTGEVMVGGVVGEKSKRQKMKQGSRVDEMLEVMILI